MRLLGRALQTLSLHREGRVGVLRISREDLEATGARTDDMDGLVDYARSLATVEIAVMVAEFRKFRKVSLRSKGVDLLPIARAFGGGGHREAAGFENDRLDSERLVEAILDTIDKKGVLQTR